MRRWIRRLTVLGGATAVALLAGFVVFTVAVWRSSPQAIAKADGIVVLTGGEHRIQEGLKLFAGGGVKRILISGVNRSTKRDELKRLSDINSVLFDCCVDIGYEALDTIGNADEAKIWAETWNFKHLIIVTSQYHMPRSLLEFGRTMPSVDLTPYPVLSQKARSPGWWLSFGAARLMLSEYVKVLPAAGRWALGRVLGPVSAATVHFDITPDDQPLPAQGAARPKISGL